jgi:hypothetical protein
MNARSQAKNRIRQILLNASIRRIATYARTNP